MHSSALLKDRGLRILSEQLGIVEAERFVVMMRREPFDYTLWREDLFGDVSLNNFLEDAQNYRNRMKTKMDTPV